MRTRLAAAADGSPEEVAETGFEARSFLQDLTGENPGDDGKSRKEWWQKTGKEKHAVREAKEPRWSIDDKPVSKAEYEALHKTLKSYRNWYCAETTDGGITGEEMKDAKGVVYDVRVEVNRSGTHSSIRRKP